MIIERVYNPGVEVVDFLLNASYHSDEVDLPGLLRLCVTDPVHYKIYRFVGNDTVFGVCLVQIIRPVMLLWLGAGTNFFNWAVEGRELLEREAVSLACNKMKFYGRLGWLRKPPPGWKATAVEFVRELT